MQVHCSSVLRRLSPGRVVERELTGVPETVYAISWRYLVANLFCWLLVCLSVAELLGVPET